MTASEQDEDLLRYMAESISLIARYTADGEETFLREPMVQDAVLRRLETLADAAGQLSDELMARHPKIPWRAIRGFRNVAAHRYRYLDMTRVWTTVRDDLAPLYSVVQEELRSFESQ